MTAGEAFEELVRVMDRLRAPGGCPWDREQTHQSIKAYLIEEAYEAADAIERRDMEELEGELGDLLLQVVFHGQMATEAGEFTIVDVVQSISAKLRRRHPHVFGEVQVRDADEVVRNWSRIKAEERATSNDPSAIAGVPRGMPSLLRAQRLGEKASRVGFDWRRHAEALAKVREEVDELAAALETGGGAAIEAELGDALFALVNVARLCSVSAEEALARALDRFGDRFRRLEDWFREHGDGIERASPAEREAAWQRLKGSSRDPGAPDS